MTTTRADYVLQRIGKLGRAAVFVNAAGRVRVIDGRTPSLDEIVAARATEFMGVYTRNVPISQLRADLLEMDCFD